MIKNIYSFAIFTLIIVCCKTKQKTHISSYLDYKAETAMLPYFISESNCKAKDSIAKLFKSIDYYSQLKNNKGNCEALEFAKNDLIDNEMLKNDIIELLNIDQEVRQGYHDITATKNYKVKDIANYYYEKVAKVDSLNAKKFRTLLNELGEWPGSKYIERKPGEPKLEVLIGHFPEKDYVDFALKAYNAARFNKEYWSRVVAMINYSRTRPIEKNYIETSEVIIPLRFTEFNKSDAHIVENDIMHLEFETISNPGITPVGKDGDVVSPTYELSSSLENLVQRKKILFQAKDILLKKGMKEKYIKLNFNKADAYNDYIMFYKMSL